MLKIDKVMKKKLFIIILIAAIVCVLVALALLFWNYTKLPNGSAEISGNIVDNDWNNYNSQGLSDLVRIDDKLYYNYEKNGFNYGLYQIDKNGSKRIYWQGIKLMPGPYGMNYDIRKNSNNLLMYAVSMAANEDDEILSYEFDKEQFVPTEDLKQIPGIRMNFIEHDDKIYYIKCGEYSLVESLSCYDDGIETEISKESDLWFDIANNCIYYVTNDYLKPTLKKYDINSTEITTVCKLNGSAYTLLMTGDYLVFDAFIGEKTQIYSLNLTDENPKPKLICAETAKIKSKTFSNDSGYNTGYDFTKWNINSFNVYDGKAYFALRSGLICHDLETDEEVVLSEKNVEECYIVDDMWIYFVDNHKTLWRVTQDGKTTERVFG